VGAGAPALACELQVGGAPASPQIDYDVYGLDRSLASTELDLVNVGDSRCSVHIDVEGLGELPPPFPIEEAGVAIAVLAPGLQRPADGLNVPGRFALEIIPGEQRSVQLDFFTDQLVSVPSGTYTRDLQIEVFAQGGDAPVESYLTQLVLVSAAQAQINIAGTDGRFDKASYMESIDFGEAEPGESRRVFVQARSNASATLSMRSVNAGRMVHDTQAGSAIAYSVTLDGDPLDLSAPVTLPGLSATGLTGRSRPLDITIDSLIAPYAGLYSDRIVIEIEAQ